MARLIELTVKIKFTEKIVTDEELQEVVDNVSEALSTQIENVGIAPENSNAITSRFEVFERHSGASNKRTFLD